MPSITRLRAPIAVIFGTIMAAMAFAGPAQAADPVYPPSAPTQVLSNSAGTNVPTEVAAVSEGAGSGELAFTGTSAVGLGALGGLLLVGGATLVSGSRRRKSSS